MGDMLSAIHDDMDEYVELCKRFGEKVIYCDYNKPDCYGLHARRLGRRAEEIDKKARGVVVPIENEVKIEMNNPRKVKHIYDLLARPKWELQTNYLFSFDGKFLRLRHESGKAYLTAKGNDLGDLFNKRSEAECEIPVDFFNQFVKIADSSSDLLFYKKSRASGNYLGCKVCLDKFLGRNYCEIEGDNEKIKQIISELGLEACHIEKLSYLEMLIEEKKYGGKR